MQRSAVSTRAAPPPAIRDVVQLLKPITWFPPMWAFMCGAVSSGAGLDGRLWFVAGGVLLAGPLVCGTSQAVNDWFDRHVDAINEPDRPLPSGRIAGRWGLYRGSGSGAVVAAVWSWRRSSYGGRSDNRCRLGCGAGGFSCGPGRTSAGVGRQRATVSLQDKRMDGPCCCRIHL